MSPLKNLELLWNNFMECKDLYQKNAWLDLFLAELIIEHQSGKNVKEILPNGLIGGITTIIGCELLSDIHEICSKPGDVEDLNPLRNYLLHDRGWRILLILNTLGVKNVSCAKELASLLITLYPVCFHAKTLKRNSEFNPYVFYAPRPEIENIFNFKSYNKSISPSQISPKMEFLGSSRLRRVKSPNSFQKGESESERDDDPIFQNKSTTPLKIRLNPMDFDYFTSVVRSGDELDKNTYMPNKKSPRKHYTNQASRDFETEESKLLLKSSINSNEFFLLVINLLESLCDVELISSSSDQISIYTINFALENLCTLQFGSAPMENLTKQQIAKLKSALTYLLLTALEKVLSAPEIIKTIIHNGILPVMLKILEDALRKQIPKIEQEEAEEIHICIFGLANAIITFLYSLLQQRNTQDKLRDFQELFSLFTNAHNGQLIEKTINLLLDLPIASVDKALVRSKKILDILGQLIILLKKRRSDLTHSNYCKRAQHKKCLMIHSHHHQDIFGDVYLKSPLGNNASHICCISNIFMILVRLLNKNDSLNARILKIMTSAGTCSCFPLRNLLVPLVEFIKKINSKLRNAVFYLLEKTIYIDLDVFVFSETCTLCQINNNPFNIAKESPPLFNKPSNIQTTMSFHLYHSLVSSKDKKIVHSVMTHLLRITPKCIPLVKQELLTQVFFPTFLETRNDLKSQPATTPINNFKIYSCLSFFVNILYCNPLLCENFIALQGLQHVIDLSENSRFVNLTCVILEIIAMSEITQFESQAINNENINLMVLTSIELLQNEAQSTTKEFFLFYENIFDENGNEFKQDKDIDINGNGEEENDLIAIEENSEFNKENNIRKYLNLLSKVHFLWRTCANLCNHSSIFGKKITSNYIGLNSLRLMNLIIQIIKSKNSFSNDCKDQTTEISLYMKLMESALAILLIIHPNINGKEISLQMLVDHLQNLLFKGETWQKTMLESSTTTRRLVEVLINSSVLVKCKGGARCLTEHVPGTTLLVVDFFDQESERAEAPSGEISDHESSLEDDEYQLMDEGYDGDVEHQGENWHRHSTTHIDNTTITYPELIALAMNLLIEYNYKFYQYNFSSNNEPTHLMNLSQCLQRLTTLCREKKKNANRLAKNRIISILLIGFNDLLIANNDKYSDFQRIILELVFILSSQRILPSELKLYLHFFKGENPPLHHILTPLTSLASLIKAQPNFHLKYPILTSSQEDHFICEFSTLNDSSYFHASKINRSHRKKALFSSWSSFGSAIALSTDLGWNIEWHGCSLSMWLRLHRCSNTNFSSENSNIVNNNVNFHQNGTTADQGILVTPHAETSNGTKASYRSEIHLFSLGSDKLTIEFWSNSIHDLIIIKLTYSDEYSYQVISSASLEGCFPGPDWCHLGINIKEFMSKKKQEIEISVIINGWRERLIKLHYPTSFHRNKTSSMNLLLGHIIYSPSSFTSDTVFNFGNLMFFRSPVITRERALALKALGPNFHILTECALERFRMNIGHILNPRTLQSNIKWDQLIDETGSILKEFRENILIVYSAERPLYFSLFRHTSNQTGLVGSFFPGNYSSRIVGPDNRPSQQVPLNMPVMLIFTPIQKEDKSLLAASSFLGGLRIFLFLFARVVEINNNEEIQAQALRLLLQLAHKNSEFLFEFHQLECSKLIMRVLTSSRCQPRLHIVKTILDACLDRPIVQVRSCGRELIIPTITEAILVNPQLLESTIDSWRAWDRNEDGGRILAGLFQALQALLRDQHPHRDFNAKQMNRANLVEGLLRFCKERFLCEDTNLLESSVCTSLVELVRSLMGAPPEFAHIVAVTDCLILLHPANCTYLPHMRHTFYFLLTPTPPRLTPESTSTTSIINKRKRTASYQKFIEPRLFSSTDGLTDHPLDPNKLNKAMTNLQIKANNDSNIYENNEKIIYDSEYSTIDIETLVNQFPNLIEDIKKFENDSQEDLPSSWLISEELLLLLHDTLLVLPDNMAPQVLGHVVTAEILLILANHRNARVRTAVVKVLSAYLQRAIEEEVQYFIKNKGFYHLANQLSLYPATVELVEACVTLVTRCRAQLDEQPFLACLSDLNSNQLASLPLLSALIPRSIHDVSLCHNILIFIRELMLKSPEAICQLLQSGFVETIIKTSVAICQIPSHLLETTEISDYQQLMDNLREILMVIIIDALGRPDSDYLPLLSEILLQLTFLEKDETSNTSIMASYKAALRDTQCFLLDGALDFILNKIGQIPPTGSGFKLKSTASFFASVLTTGSEVNESSGGNTSSSTKSSERHYPITRETSTSSIINMHLIGALNKAELSRSDLVDRFKQILQKAVQFFVQADISQRVLTSSELTLVQRLLTTLTQGLAAVADRRKPSGTDSKRSFWVGWAWPGVSWSSREHLRLAAASLVPWALAPGQTPALRMAAVNVFTCQDKPREIMTSIFHTHAKVVQKFSLFLWELAESGDETSLTSSERKLCIETLCLLDQWGIAGLGPPILGSERGRVWANEARELASDVLLGEDVSENLIAPGQPSISAVHRAVHRYEDLQRTIASSAQLITRKVVERQNDERKSLMERMKQRYTDGVHIRLCWQQIVRDVCHERAIWFFSKSYPSFWELDSTEGPARIRNRLQRCHLKLKDKYLMSEFQDKLASSEKSSPLSYLFTSGEEVNTSANNSPSTSSVLIERLHTNEKIRHMTTARIVTPAHDLPGELLIGETCIYFVHDDLSPGASELCLQQNSGCVFDISSTFWHFEDVKEIHNRRFQLQERAIEIFLLNGKTYLIAFDSAMERDKFVSVLGDCSLPNRVANDSLTDAVHLWREGLLTNWEYLTHLNKMAGRSYNDLMQYPVFPFVLADYTSNELDLNNPKVFRNFKKPMAVQNKKNEQHYITNYNYLKNEIAQGTLKASVNTEPFHYGSHYSNSGTVLHFLVRLPPFTKMFLTYQDNNFDLPDRTFHSLHTTWKLTSSESTTDVKELIPEFFYLPEFLINFEGFDFGMRQNGERVHNVKLPQWCQDDPRLFILVHRQSLETPLVRELLPHWIDLVFGFRQTGKQAVEAINVFHPATYYGFDVESIEDPVERSAWETMVRTYGQTPRQLFRAAHPMIIQNLDSQNVSSHIPDVIKGVKGLSWGSYVGSPAEIEPNIVRKHMQPTPIAKFIELSTNDVFGIPQNTTLLVSYAKEKGSNLGTSISIMSIAIVSWAYPDGIVRVKLKKDQSPWCIFSYSSLDPVTICVSTPDCLQLWAGFNSGKIMVYRFRFLPERGQLAFERGPITLLGHTGPIMAIHLCPPFSIGVSTSQDGTAIIWDLNKLSYVRSLNAVSLPVTLVSVSDTSGDIVTVSYTEPGSTLRLHTINASLIESVTTPEQITSVCFSNAPEGISVNVIATGFINGIIRLWSTWDMTLIREIIHPSLTAAIISIIYSHDCHHLYASDEEGLVVIWDGTSTKNNSKTSKFINLTIL